MSEEYNYQGDVHSITINVPSGVDAEEVSRIVRKALEPADAGMDVKGEDETRPDYIDFADVEPLVLDVVALLKMMSKVDTAMVSGEGVKLNYRQTRVLHRLLVASIDPKTVDEIMNNVHATIIGTYYDHEKYDDN